jgi:hypothetical protein
MQYAMLMATIVFIIILMQKHIWSAIALLILSSIALKLLSSKIVKIAKQKEKEHASGNTGSK